jgi:uncharacterized integral membrane protein
VARRGEILEHKVIQIGGEMKYIVVILASLVVGMLLALIVSGG